MTLSNFINYRLGLIIISILIGISLFIGFNRPKDLGIAIIFVSMIYLFDEIKRILYLSKSKEEYKFKSNEERFIASYFNKKGIKYYYEKPLEIDGNLLHPDFYLPEYDIYVEYWGQYNDPFYYKTQYLPKKKLYKQEKIQLIDIYSDNIKDKFGKFSMNLLDKKFTYRLLPKLRIGK